MKALSALSERLRNLPIRRKLRLISGLTAAIALTLAGLGMLIADSLVSYRYLKSDLGTFSSVIANNSTGALAFEDSKVAAETLAALKPRTHVQIACLFQTSGRTLARYVRPGFSGSCPAPTPQRIRAAGLTLVTSEPVQLDGRPLGALVLQYDLGEIFERGGLYTLIVLAALGLSYVLTITLSSRLRAVISTPILDLADVAYAVTKSSDYSIRARKNSKDEIGLLSDAMNSMIEAVQSRDHELQKSLDAQKSAYDELAALNAELQRSNTDLERFAFMASHDLQEPLRMITMYSHMLVAMRDSAEKTQLEEFARYIGGGTARMRELLADLLSYSEIAGSADRELETVNLDLVVSDALEFLKGRLDEVGAEVFVDRLPELRAHRNRLDSLFQNLLDNAVKYRSDAHLQIRISVALQRDQLKFSVRDNGIGIPEEYHSKIFVAFQRLHGKEIPGTGIGLAISKRVIERYGGTIWVESKQGEGTTFHFTLPLDMVVKNDRAEGQST